VIVRCAPTLPSERSPSIVVTTLADLPCGPLIVRVDVTWALAPVVAVNDAPSANSEAMIVVRIRMMCLSS
jgi:hypothetical protein